MKRKKFVTDNRIPVHRYVYIVLVMLLLAMLLLTISAPKTMASLLIRSDKIASILGSDANFSWMVAKDSEKTTATAITISAESDSLDVALYAFDKECTLLQSQMNVMKQAYRRISSLQDAEDCDLLILSGERLRAADVRTLTNLVKNGLNILLWGINENETNPELYTLCGVESWGEYTTWSGIRISSDLLGENISESKKTESSGVEIALGANVKAYAAGLPSDYESMENEDLPPLFWRCVPFSKGGSVYVANGSFCTDSTGYLMLPVILAEINGAYIYPVLNAYCVTASGYPFAQNEHQENWDRLYGRDRLGIQNDMLDGELNRFTQVYEIRLTCFSEDYSIFYETDDPTLLYYRDEWTTSGNELALEKNGLLYLTDDPEDPALVPWTENFSFMDEEDNKFKFPLGFKATVDVSYPENVTVDGFLYGLGFFASDIDIDDFMDYDGKIDMWVDYCNNLEIMLGTHKRDYPWLERISLGEAFSRLQSMWRSDIKASYGDDRITLEISENAGFAFMLRTSHEKLTGTGCSITELGGSLYLVTPESEEICITWEDVA